MDRRIKISVGGCQDVADIVRENLSKINLFEIIKSDTLRQSDIIYWVFGRGPSIKNFFPIWIKKDPLIINHWIGSDILWEKKDRTRPNLINSLRKFVQDSIIRRKIKIGGLINLTTAPWLVDELSDLHISAINLPITTLDLHELGTVDIHRAKDIDFLSYVPFKKFEFYGGDKILQLANRWQNYIFLLVCADLNEIPLDLVEKMPKNVILSPKVKWKNMFEFYNRSKFFIRYTSHDAISLSVLESLYFKLQVLWTYDFPFTQKIETQEKLSDSIPALIQNWHPNEDGHVFVIENYSIEKWRSNFLEIIKTKTTLLK